MAYEASDILAKDNKFVAHTEKQMRDLLNYKYIFEPSFF